ncbi:hypothetical protein VTO58DRAFT_109429 [Aureobasidium pullulans]
MSTTFDIRQQILDNVSFAHRFECDIHLVIVRTPIDLYQAYCLDKDHDSEQPIICKGEQTVTPDGALQSLFNSTAGWAYGRLSGGDSHSGQSSSEEGSS